MAHQPTESKRRLSHYRGIRGGNGGTSAFAGPVFGTTGHGDVLAQLRAATESNILNLRSR